MPGDADRVALADHDGHGARGTPGGEERDQVRGDRGAEEQRRPLGIDPARQQDRARAVDALDFGEIDLDRCGGAGKIALRSLQLLRQPHGVVEVDVCIAVRHAPKVRQQEQHVFHAHHSVACEVSHTRSFIGGGQ